MRAIVYHKANSLTAFFSSTFVEGQAINLLGNDSEYRPVATYDAVGPMHDAELLEKVFELTNHIHGPWWNNTDVVKCNRNINERSTSVGDVVVIEFDDGSEATYGCAPIGWVKITH